MTTGSHSGARTPVPDLTVSIATTNHRDMLRDCLHSVFAGTRSASLEVFVVDSGSTDGALEMLAREFPRVRVIRNVQFPGFSAAHNQALRQSRGRYVMILNDDTLVGAGAFDRMVAFADANPRIGAMGPRLLNRDGSHQTSSYMDHPSFWTEWYTRCVLLSWLWERRRRRLPDGVDYVDNYGTYNGDTARVRRVRHLMGACILVRRSVLEQVGILDERYFLSYEDQDWCKRIGDAGWDVVYYPESRVVHFGNQTVCSVAEYGDIFLASRQLFARKHVGRASAALVRPTFAAIAAVNGTWMVALRARRALLDAWRGR